MTPKSTQLFFAPRGMASFSCPAAMAAYNEFTGGVDWGVVTKQQK